eukprot:CAMPEP_0197022576 /NCGR_PEP_ID=MMETSP1384-20130603/3410_1 /TAXON_ID=29189 /ORGANISM="Ammonia sp." /LENGTH=220 /DNA_ID=CAMNT_0042450643 /DNA_START=22 /DNA_END=684 /DNA_ORIENTATION=+
MSSSVSLADPQPTVTEDEIITKRVMYAEDGGMEACLSSFYSFYDSLVDEQTDTKQIEHKKNDLLYKLEMSQLKTQLGKQCELTLAKDIEFYQQQLKSLRVERESIIKHIETLKHELDAAKTKRDYQEEYNIMINQINKEVPRQQTSKAIDEMNCKLQHINHSLHKCNKAIQMRSKQCYAAFAAIQALNRSISQTIDTPNDAATDNDNDNGNENDNDVMMQ